MLLLTFVLFAVDTILPLGIYVAAEYFEFSSGLIKYLSIYLSISIYQLKKEASHSREEGVDFKSR